MKKIFYIGFITFLGLGGYAQNVAINTNGSTADASSMLDISSTDKGLLIPRMTTAQRIAIASPADGLLVFDTDTKSFWYFSLAWKEMNLNGGGGSFSLPYSGVDNIPGKVFSINNTDSSNGTAALYGRSGLVGAGITPGINAAVWGDNYRGLGILGTSVNGIGTSGFSFQNHGVSGYSTNNSFAGVYGSHANDGAGVFGETSSGNGGKGIYGKSTGTSAFAGFFESTNESTSYSTLYAANNGWGNGIYSISNNGSAAKFQILNSNNSSNGIESLNSGTNSAGYFLNSNQNNTSPALSVYNAAKGNGLQAACSDLSPQSSAVYAFHNGSGNAISGFSKFGHAGEFQTMEVTNTSSTVHIWNSGTGDGITAYNANANSTSPVIRVSSDHNGNGLQTTLSNPNNSSAAIYAYTFGPGQGILAKSEKGVPGMFNIDKSANTSTALYASTVGTGSGLMIENFYVGSISSLATFRKSGNNVARIDGTGKGFFNGGTQNSGADLAEAFDVTGNRNEYEAGDVLVISVDKDRAVEKSAGAYSTLVAGVYATKPGVLLTEENIETDLSDKVPMGVVGVIPTKVCLEGGAIKRGDLLVTSSVSGVAMKADIDKIKPGQIIGKALENFSENGVGKIKVLVNVK